MARRFFVSLTALLLAGTVFAVASSQAAPKSGTIIPAFGTGGRTLTGFQKQPDDGAPNQFAVKADGSSIVLGTSGKVMFLAGFNADGSSDPGFGDAGFADPLFSNDGKPLIGTDLALQSDGRAVIGGASDIFAGGILARLNRDGSQDRTFGNNGTVSTSTRISLLAVDPADRLIVVTTAGPDTTVSRYSANGEPDRNFGVDGAVTHRFGNSSGLYEISLAANRITIAGPGGILRMLNDGTRDAGFGGGDGQVNPGTQVMTVLSDGRILSVNSGSVTRLLGNGSIDTTFGENGTSAAYFATYADITTDSQGRILLGGATTVLDNINQPDFELARLTASGLPDSTFGGDGVVSTDVTEGGGDYIQQVTVLPGDRVQVGGYIRPAGFGLGGFTLARYTQSGVPDPSFGEGTGIRSLSPLLASRDRVLDSASARGGRTVVVGGAGYFAGIALYKANGKPDPGFDSDGLVTDRFTNSRYGDVAESVAVQPDGQIVVCLSSTEGSALVRYRTDGKRDHGFGQNGIAELPTLRHCGSVLIQDEGQIVTVGINLRNYPQLTMVSGDGQPVTAFGEDGIATGPRFSLSGGGTRHIEGELTTDGGIVVAGDRFGATIQRFTLSGELVKKFGQRGVVKLRGGRNGAFLGRGEALDVTKSGRILVGGTSRKKLAIVALDPNGKVIRSFGKNGVAQRKVLDRSTVNDIEGLSNGDVIATGAAREKCELTSTSCDERTLAIRLNYTGDPDTSFGTDGLFTKRFNLRSTGAAIQSGKTGITIAGSSITRTERSQFLLTRLRR